MNVHDLLQQLGHPHFRMEQAGDQIFWFEWDDEISPPEIIEISRDDSSQLARALRYVLYTVRIRGVHYVSIGMGGCEDGGSTGYWPHDEIYERESC